MSLTKVRPHAAGGFLLLELVIGTAILGLLLLAVSRLLADYQSATRTLLLRERLAGLAQSRLDEIRAGQRAMQDAVETIDPDTTLEIRITGAEGAWAPLHLVEVSASAPLRAERRIRAVTRAYVAPSPAPPEVKP